MGESMIDRLSDKFFEKLGKPKPALAFNIIDYYRFKLAYNFLLPGSVLDIGAYFGDFLKIVRKNDPARKIYGTDINRERVDLCNKNLGENVVRLDSRNGILSSFDESSVDNVVCTEVIEHIPNNKLAISELCRVARKRVIITFPYDEKIINYLCIHCCKYTPASGHLHSYKLNSFDKMIPIGWVISKRGAFANIISRILARKFNNLLMVEISETIFCKIFSKKRYRWMYVIIDSVNKL